MYMTEVRISIHALRGEGDVKEALLSDITSYFNPRPPWGGRRPASERAAEAVIFQSTPSVGRATSNVEYFPYIEEFQSTPSVGRATGKVCFAKVDITISIHALRGEGDDELEAPIVFMIHFNPRPPWGGRQRMRGQVTSRLSFQSTPSVGRATFKDNSEEYKELNFNPRPPWGGRPAYQSVTENQRNFNPRPPWGGRLQKYTNMQCYACT